MVREGLLYILKVRSGLELKNILTSKLLEFEDIMFRVTSAFSSQLNPFVAHGKCRNPLRVDLDMEVDSLTFCMVRLELKFYVPGPPFFY
jgi:hypothetical protein